MNTSETDSVQRTLGRIEGHLQSLDERLHEHTAQDATAFAEIRMTLQMLSENVARLKTDRDVSRAVATRTSAFVSVIVGSFIALGTAAIGRF